MTLCIGYLANVHEYAVIHAVSGGAQNSIYHWEFWGRVPCVPQFWRH
jgi:hypothetical protein